MGRLRSNESFLRLFAGRVVTNVGDSLYAVAAMWLIYDLTGSSFYTGIAGFLSFGPQALKFLVGPFVDRWSLRRLLVGTQLLQCLGVLLVPLAAATGHLSVWLVLVLVPVLTFLNQFVYPAQYAALPRIVEEDRLVRANSLLSFANQGTSIAFNAVAGVLITVIGAVALYLLDAVTFAVAILLFLGLAIPKADQTGDGDDEPANARVAQYVAELREGIDYVRGSALFALVMGAAIVNFGYGMMVAVLPEFADSLGGASVYGLLTAAMAAGTLIGAASASLVEDVPYGRLAIAGFLLTALSWTGALVVPGLAATVSLFFAAWVPAGVVNVIDQSLIQSVVDDAMLGRVRSVASSLASAMMPVGALFGGTVAGAYGSTTAMAGLAVGSAFFGLYFLAHPRLRTLPRVSEANETALGLG